MNIFQFLRIFWARRVIITAATASCLIGAILVTIFVQPRWVGTARAILEVLKPDATTGQAMGGPSQRVYIAAQTALVTDYSVAGRVVDELGWLSDPALIAAYHKRPKSDTSDFRHWLAARVIQKTTANVVQGTNILEINYSASKPDQARAAAEAIRDAYIGLNLQLRRNAADRDADWFEKQAEKARTKLETSQAALDSYEQKNGVAMADNTIDVDTLRLKSISGQGVLPPPVPLPPQASAADMELAQVDGQLAHALKTLGPNHPDVQALQEKRKALAALAVHEATKRAADVATTRAQTTTAVQQALSAERTKVLGEQGKIAELNRLQSLVTLDKAQFDKTQGRALELRQQAAITNAEITPLGGATVPSTPAFPNVPLIIAGALVLGVGMGVLAALLSELLAPRVRSIEDLQHAIEAPMLVVIAGPSRMGARSMGRKLGPISRLRRQKAA